MRAFYVLTASIALEYHEVLQRPAVLKLTELDHQQSADLVTSLIALSQEVQINFTWRPNLTDESDNKFVEAAITYWFLTFWLAHDWIYRIHGNWFKVSVGTFDAIHYAGITTYKVGIFLLNLVPYLALAIM